MKVLGIVEWTKHDKGGYQIAGVRPLLDVGGVSWRSVDAAEEFPPQGQVFWPSAREALEDMLVFFRAETNNSGQKDQYKLVEPRQALDIIDLREIGTPVDVRAAFAFGLHRPDLRTCRALLWCAPNVFVGPVSLIRDARGFAAFSAPNRDRIATFDGTTVDPRPIKCGSDVRTVHSSPNIAPSNGFVDWDDDRLVIRRAIASAVERAKHSSADIKLTKKLIDEAADAVVTGGGLAELQLERYRLELAQRLCGDAIYVSTIADDLSQSLMAHPAIRESLLRLRDAARFTWETEMRAEMQQRLAVEQMELNRLATQRADAAASLAVARAELDAANQRATASVEEAQRLAAAAEGELLTRLNAAIERPAAMFGDVALLRPFLNNAETQSLVRESGSVIRMLKPRVASAVTDVVTLRRALTTTAKYCGTQPKVAVRIHAAVCAGLMPIMTGNGGFAALAAYARAVFAGRLVGIHVLPGFMDPIDLLRAIDLGVPSKAATSDGLTLVVFQGVNRAPTESYLAPLFQTWEQPVAFHDHADGRAMGVPNTVRMAGTATAGATCVPISEDLWSQAVAIDAASGSLQRPSGSDEAGELPASSELFQPAETPADVIDEIVSAWPPADEALYTMERFGAALARFHDDRASIKAGLVECVILPRVVSLASEDERAQALSALDHLVGVSDQPRGEISQLAGRLRRRLGFL